jgi:hypothetical protein
MKRLWPSLLFIVLSLLLSMFLVEGSVSGQSPQPGDEDYEPPPGAPAAPALLEEPLAPLPQPVDSPDDAQDVTGIASDLVIVDDIVQVQGRLTDADGAPIDGNRTIVASLYDVATAGVARCFDSDTVAVNNGLFVMNMDSCTASDINGDRLYLGIKVGADNEMTPRQQIFATPYAWALRPGSIIKGADSYVFVPGSSLIKNLSADSTRWDIRANGAARVFRGATAGGKTIYIPISLPAVLYGQNVTIGQVTVYYRVSNGANAFITRTVLNVQTDADSQLNIVDDATDRTSTTATSYSFAPTTNNELAVGQGALAMFLQLSFVNDTDYVDIAAVRLRLDHF